MPSQPVRLFNDSVLDLLQCSQISTELQLANLHVVHRCSFAGGAYATAQSIAMTGAVGLTGPFVVAAGAYGAWKGVQYWRSGAERKE